MSFSLHRHCDQTIGGHWQSPGIHGRNQQFLIIFIILLFWMFSPFKHKPSRYKMMDEGEMIGIQGYHLKFLGLVPPSLIPLNKKSLFPLQPAGLLLTAAQHAQKQCSLGEFAFLPQQNMTATGIRYHCAV